jgi:AraC-like DNA-binding protein
MKELEQLTLTRLQHLFEKTHDEKSKNYISHHLAIARDIRPEHIKEQFASGPKIMTEMRILLVLQGWANVELNLMEQHIEAGDLIYLGTNGIFQYYDSSPDLKGIGLSMSDELFQLAIGNHIPKSFDGHLRDFHFSLRQEEIEFLNTLHHLIYLSTHIDGSGYQVLLQLISSFLWYSDHLHSQHEENDMKSITREQRLFTEFLNLVNEHAGHAHTIDFYADHLCLSPRYMSTLIKKMSGKGAKEWIDAALLTRIKIALRHTDRPLGVISDEMGFPNTSFFCNFFKRLAGMPPGEYRKGGIYQLPTKP